MAVVTDWTHDCKIMYGRVPITSQLSR